jgi:site-specific DNA-methyltransferase (cytosine-N4-specific)
MAEPDQRYLKNWFDDGVLQDLERVVGTIQAQKNTTEQNMLWLSLSNVLRRVSWQKDDDLRVRRDVHDASQIDTAGEFLKEVGRSVKLIVGLLLQCRGDAVGRGVILEGDAREIQTSLGKLKGRADAVVTSPPYATALPYLDTDRLSLIYLKLLSRPDHRHRDLQMIGNREVTDRVRRAYWETFRSDTRRLPGSVVRLINRIHRLNSEASVGFRRRNLPALLAKYFIDMKQAFDGLHFLLRNDRPAYVVVGSNHTFAGGHRVEIKTAQLLAELAEGCGFVCDDLIPMEMLTSRDIFKKNASTSETIVCLRRR